MAKRKSKVKRDNVPATTYVIITDIPGMEGVKVIDQSPILIRENSSKPSNR